MLKYGPKKGNRFKKSRTDFHFICRKIEFDNFSLKVNERRKE
jgi:hypothetical protein